MSLQRLCERSNQKGEHQHGRGTYHWKIEVFQDCFQVDKRVLGTSEEKQAMPEEAEKVNQEEQS